MKPPVAGYPDHGAVWASQLEGNGCWQGPAHARSASGAEEGARLLRLVEVGHPSTIIACIEGEKGRGVQGFLHDTDKPLWQDGRAIAQQFRVLEVVQRGFLPLQGSSALLGHCGIGH